MGVQPVHPVVGAAAQLQGARRAALRGDGRDGCVLGLVLRAVRLHGERRGAGGLRHPVARRVGGAAHPDHAVALRDETFTKHQPVYTNDENDWFRLQLATTMDVDCPWWMHWFHGGLQFQIEHHLFPRVPRHNLREVQRMVKDFCKREGLYHHSVSFLQGNKEVIGGLYQTALAARELPAMARRSRGSRSRGPGRCSTQRDSSTLSNSIESIFE